MFDAPRRRALVVRASGRVALALALVASVAPGSTVSRADEQKNGARMTAAGWGLLGVGAAGLGSSALGGVVYAVGGCDDVFAGPRGCRELQGAYLAIVSAGLSLVGFGVGIPLLVIGKRRERAGRATPSAR